MAISLEIFILALFVFWFVFFIVQAYNIFFRGFAPFIATKKEVITKAIDEIDFSKVNTVYELGCGQAGFLHSIRRRNKAVKLVGFEYALLPVVLAKIQNWLLKSNIQIIKKNIFKADIAEADLVYCYLNIKMMQELKEKFKKELRPGAQIVSFEFRLPDWPETKAVKSDGSTIYFYTV